MTRIQIVQSSLSVPRSLGISKERYDEIAFTIGKFCDLYQRKNGETLLSQFLEEIALKFDNENEYAYALFRLGTELTVLHVSLEMREDSHSVSRFVSTGRIRPKFSRYEAEG